MNEIACHKLMANTHALASGEVEGTVALALNFHATRCKGCEASLASARRVVRLLESSAYQSAEPPARLVESIMAALPEDPQVVRRRRHAWGLSVAAAGVGAGLGLALVLMLAAGSGAALGSPFSGIRSVLAAAAFQLQQFGGLLAALAGKMPRLPTWTAHTSDGGARLGLTLVLTGLLGTLSVASLTAVRGLARLRRS